MSAPRLLIVLAVPLLCLRCTLAQTSYRVSPGDVLDVQVFRHPERSGAYAVRHDGRITYPATGEIEVAGKTIEELTAILTEALRKDLRDPVVVINVSTRQPHFIYVLGEVPRSGPQDVEQDGVTVKEALAAAGGLPDTADPVAKLHRSGRAPEPIDLDHEMDVGPDQATRLYEDDILYVEPLLQGYVGVVGTAGAPRRIPYEKGDDILDVLAKGGGAGEDVDLQHAVILRADGAGETVDLEAMQEGRWEGDLPRIGPDDFLILPAAGPQEFVTVIGQVGSKKLPIDRKKGLSLAEIIAASAPFPPEVDATQARLLHANGEVLEIDLRALTEGTGDDALLQMQMQPDDVIVIPKQLAEVAAIGEVSKPGIYPLDRGDRVLDLVKQVGVAQVRRGEPRFALLVRRATDPDVEPETLKLDLNALISGRAEQQNVELEPEDILFVPSPGRKWTEKLSEYLQPFNLLRSSLLLFSDPFGRDYGR